MVIMAVKLSLLPAQTTQQLLAQLHSDIIAIQAILTARYINPLPPVYKQGNLYLAWEYMSDPAHHPRFVNMLRVTPHVFTTILHLIEDHPVFHNNSNIPQAPVQVQLTVMLYRMGRYGNGASVEDIAKIAGISEGSVEHYTDHTQEALISLHDIFIRPLTDAEKEIEKHWIEEQLGFNGSSWREG